jgi:anti-sigma28 factor (negative regulator of flagellin synthesis)
MQEKETPASEFVETLRAAAAAVGQQAGADRDGQYIQVDQDREARIAELQRKYAEGSYQVSAADVAARMVDDHLT